MDTFTLSRNFCNFAFENPEKINPGHYAIYFFAIEHCNRLGWKEKFGFPSQMVMEATGIKNWRTYQKYLQDLIDFGFIKMIEISKNQYSSNIIAIVKNTKALDKALDKALQKHHTKHSQSIASIDIQETIEQETNKQVVRNKEVLKNKLDSTDSNSVKYDFYTFLYNLGEKMKEELNEEIIESIEEKLNSIAKRIGKERIVQEIENFILYHTTEKTVFKSTILRLNTWFNKLK